MDPTLPVSDLPMVHGNADDSTLTGPTAPTMAASGLAEVSAFAEAEPEPEAQAESLPAEVAVESFTIDEPTAPATVTDDATDPVAPALEPQGAATGRGDSHSPSTTAAPTEAAEPTAALSMKDLFGPFFRIDEIPTQVADPALVDTRSVLHTHFGDYVTEEDVVKCDAEFLSYLVAEMQANNEAREQAMVEHLFGAAGLTVLTTEKPEPFTMLTSTLPVSDDDLLRHDALEAQRRRRRINAVGEDEDVWLIEMPTMLPARQTLHADPQPFFPSACEVLQSDDRSLYTPRNVLRWTHDQKSNTFMSNSRVVRWSDGSVTLHVGSDTFSLETAKGNAAAHLLGNATTVSMGAVSLNAVTKTLNPQTHFVIEATEAESIERVVMAEAAQHRTATHRMNLAFASNPLPEVDWLKPNAARNPFEEYVAMEYERRSKELQRRFKEGRPMTLQEQLAADHSLFQDLNTANVDELVERQKEDRRQAALQSARRAEENRAAGGGRSRFQRSTCFDGHAATAATDPFAAELDSNNDDEGDDNDGSDESEDMQAMMDRLQAEHDRREAANDTRAVKRARVEDTAGSGDEGRRYQPLLAALEAALQTIPATEREAYSEVDGMIAYMKGESFSASVLETEIRSLATAVGAQVPVADLTDVWAAYEAIFDSA